MSLGGYGYSQTLADAVNYAVGKGVVVVAAAGNSGADVTHFYPASLPGVITVAATDKYGIAWWSNWGSAVDVTAPGVSILSTLPDNHYANWSGTSMATPFVSGYAAFLKALHQEYNRFEIEAQLESQANQSGLPGWNDRFGYGVIDMGKAGQKVDFAGWALQVESPARGSAVSGETPLVVDVNPRLVDNVVVKDEQGHVVANLANPGGDYLLRGRFDAASLSPGQHSLTFTAFDSRSGRLSARTLPIAVRSPNQTGLQIKVLDPLGHPAKAWISVYHAAKYRFWNQEFRVYEWTFSGETNDAGDMQLGSAVVPDGTDFLIYANMQFAGPDGRSAFAMYTRMVSPPARVVMDGIDAHPVTMNAQRLQADGSTAPMDDGYILGLAADAYGQGEGYVTTALATLEGKGSATVWMEPGTYNLSVTSFAYNHFLYQPQVKVTKETQHIDFTVDKAARLTFASDHAPYYFAGVALFNGSGMEPLLDVTQNHTITLSSGYYQAEIIDVPRANGNLYVYFLVDGFDPTSYAYQPGIYYAPGSERVLHDGTLAQPFMQSTRSYQVPATEYFSMNKFSTTTNLWLFYGYWFTDTQAQNVGQSFAGGPTMLHWVPGQEPRFDRLGVPGSRPTQQVDISAQSLGFIEPTFTVTGPDGKVQLQRTTWANLWWSWWDIPSTQATGNYLGTLDVGNIGPLGGPMHTESGIEIRKDGVTTGLRVKVLGADGQPSPYAWVEVLHKLQLPGAQMAYDFRAWGYTDGYGVIRFLPDSYFLTDGNEYEVLAFHGSWDATPPFLLTETTTTPSDIVIDASKAQPVTVTAKDETGAPLGGSVVAITAKDPAGALLDSFYAAYTPGSGQVKILLTNSARYQLTTWNFGRNYFLASPDLTVNPGLSNYTMPTGKLARVKVGKQTLPNGQSAPWGYLMPNVRGTYVWGIFMPGDTVTLTADTDYEMQDLLLNFSMEDFWAYWFDSARSRLKAGENLTLDFGGKLSASLQPVQAYMSQGRFFAYTDVRDPQSNPLIFEFGFGWGTDAADILAGKADLGNLDLQQLNKLMLQFKQMQARRHLALSLGPDVAQHPELPAPQNHYFMTPNLRILDHAGKLVDTVHDLSNWQFLYWLPPTGAGGSFTAQMVLPVDGHTDLTAETAFSLPGIWLNTTHYSPRQGALYIHLDTTRKGTMSVQVQRADGVMVADLTGAVTMASGAHNLTWNGRIGPAYAPDGDYQVIASVAETGEQMIAPFSLKSSIPDRPSLDSAPAYTNVRSLRVTGHTSPGSHLEFWVDGRIAHLADPVDANGEGFFAGDVPLGGDGTHFITAIAYDDYGNRSGYSPTIRTTLDTAGPQIRLFSPAVFSGDALATALDDVAIRGQSKGRSTVVLTVTYPDGHQDSHTYHLTYSGNFSDRISLPGPGDYQFRLVATDEAGNIGEPLVFTVHRV